MPLKKEDLIIEYLRASGPGGQRRNKKETAVRITHISTGLISFASERRSQAENKEVALARLERKITHFRKKRKKRIPTRTPQYVKERILKFKRQRREKKKLRKIDVRDID